jgi:hypothetical protein
MHTRRIWPVTSTVTATADIAQVVDRLDAIVAWSRDHGSRLGYFPALYRKVTIAVAREIERGAFDDGPRMTRLDVAFAGRYLDAIEAFRDRRPTTQAWDAAFTAAGHWWPIVLQHLLLGMNAHINLDLGIAAARCVERDELPTLRADFDRINTILAGLVAEVRDELARIWPVLRLFNAVLGRTQTTLINFSMERARDRAWAVAEELAPLPRPAQEAAIARLDRGVATFARVVRHPGFVLGATTRLVRVGELGSIDRKIAILR